VRDLDIVLVAAERWRARPRLLPRGPWREPPGALQRAQVVVVTHKVARAEAAASVAQELARVAPHAVVARLALVPLGWRAWAADPAASGPGAAASTEAPAGVAVCAVADPDSFLENARAAGARFEQALVFRDHHAFSDADLAAIERARGTGPVLTTEKDAVRLAAASPGLPLLVLGQTVQVEAGGAALLERVERALGRR